MSLTPTQVKEAAVREAMRKGAAKMEVEDLEPGLYRVFATVEISGDITIGAPTERTNNGFTDSDLVAAFLLAEDEAVRRDRLDQAVLALKDSLRSAAGKRQIKELKKTTKVWQEDIAEERKLTRTSSVKGAATGDPFVEIVHAKIERGE